jgi:GNAT superfamily N-acetyltransferase
MDKAKVSLSGLEEERFGVKTAKADEVRLEDIPGVLAFCREHGVEMLIARCPTHDLPAVQEMERQGFLLMDTLIYYSCDLGRHRPVERDSDILIRPFRKGEEDVIRTIAAEAFEGYLGHYHADARLDRGKCMDTYVDWAYRSCFHREVASEVFVGEYGGEVIAFGTVRENSPDEGQYILAGVLKPYQGMGTYRMILQRCMRWCIERDIGSIITATQVTNLAVQKVWIRLGFEPVRSYYTFHKWFTSA